MSSSHCGRCCGPGDTAPPVWEGADDRQDGSGVGAPSSDPAPSRGPPHGHSATPGSLPILTLHAALGGIRARGSGFALLQSVGWLRGPCLHPRGLHPERDPQPKSPPGAEQSLPVHARHRQTRCHSRHAWAAWAPARTQNSLSGILSERVLCADGETDSGTLRMCTRVCTRHCLSRVIGFEKPLPTRADLSFLWLRPSPSPGRTQEDSLERVLPSLVSRVTIAARGACLKQSQHRGQCGGETPHLLVPKQQLQEPAGAHSCDLGRSHLAGAAGAADREPSRSVGPGTRARTR